MRACSCVRAYINVVCVLVHGRVDRGESAGALGTRCSREENKSSMRTVSFSSSLPLSGK